LAIRGMGTKNSASKQHKEPGRGMQCMKDLS
jgi:hypothetical protein